MDDAASIPKAGAPVSADDVETYESQGYVTSLAAALKVMDQRDGFAVLRYEGREIILMTGEKFEEWEDAVDIARIIEHDNDLDAGPSITLDALAEDFGTALKKA